MYVDDSSCTTWKKNNPVYRVVVSEKARDFLVVRLRLSVLQPCFKDKGNRTEQERILY